jgi:hypothetical protein
LKELWSDRLIEIHIANPSKLHFDYDMGDIHTLTLKIKEDIEFQRGINVMLNPEKLSSL